MVSTETKEIVESVLAVIEQPRMEGCELPAIQLISELISDGHRVPVTEILDAYAATKEPEIPIVAWLNLHPEILEVLFVYAEPSTIQTVAYSNFLELLGSTDVTVAVTSHLACPPDTLAHYANHVNGTVRNEVGKHPNTPPSTLAVLANDLEMFVRVAVARNPFTPPELLDRIAHTELSVEDWPYGAVSPIHCAVAENPNASVPTLEFFVYSNDITLCSLVVDNPSTPTRLRTVAKITMDSQKAV